MKSHGKTCITPTPFIIFANGRRRKANGKRRKTQRGGKDVEIDRTPHKMRITTYYTASYEVLSADNTARRPHADHTTLFINNLNRITIMKEEMNGSVIYLVESFLEENYAFRRNLLNGKTEFAIIHPEEEDNTKNKAEYTEDLKEVDEDSKAIDEDLKAVDKDLKTQDEGLEIEKKWQVFTKEDFNSLVPLETTSRNTWRAWQYLPTTLSRISSKPCLSGMAEIMWRNSSVASPALRVNS